MHSPNSFVVLSTRADDNARSQPKRSRNTAGASFRHRKRLYPQFSQTQYWENIRAEFIVGTDQYTDRTGVLTEVGINYFVIRDVNSKTNIMCDLYSVKFVTILTE